MAGHSVAHFTDEELLAKLYALHTAAPFRNHGIGQLPEFLAGLDLIPPGHRGGAALAIRYRRYAGVPPAYLVCGVGAKP